MSEKTPTNKPATSWELIEAKPNSAPSPGVGVSKGTVGGHTGLLFHVGGKHMWMHLAFHYSFEFVELGQSQHPPLATVAPTLSELELELVTEYASLLGDRYENEGLPYGFAFRGTALSEGGSVKIVDGDCGLTCATLVMMVFRRAGIELLDTETWDPARLDTERVEEDKKAQERLLRTLKRKATELTDQATASQNMSLLEDLTRLNLHIANLKDEIGEPRFRAEEVAVASGMTQPPLAFEHVAPEGEKLLAQVKLLHGQKKKAMTGA